MQQYLCTGSYSQEGTQGVSREGGMAYHAITKRLAERLFGTLESCHFASGSADAVA